MFEILQDKSYVVYWTENNAGLVCLVQFVSLPPEIRGRTCPQRHLGREEVADKFDQAQSCCIAQLANVHYVCPDVPDVEQLSMGKKTKKPELHLKHSHPKHSPPSSSDYKAVPCCIHVTSSLQQNMDRPDKPVSKADTRSSHGHRSTISVVFLLQMGIGSRLPVYSARDCMVACETSPGCASIVWSPTSYRCFLHGCPSQFTPLCTVSGCPQVPQAMALYHACCCAAARPRLMHMVVYTTLRSHGTGQYSKYPLFDCLYRRSCTPPPPPAPCLAIFRAWPYAYHS